MYTIMFNNNKRHEHTTYLYAKSQYIIVLMVGFTCLFIYGLLLLIT